LPVVEVKQAKNKALRIEELGPYFENGKIRVSPDDNDFLLEYLQFPKGRHDDILDAVHIAFSLIIQDSARPNITPVTMSSD
jgi:predicted phage terminase large subunit-like protein